MVDALYASWPLSVETKSVKALERDTTDIRPGSSPDPCTVFHADLLEEFSN